MFIDIHTHAQLFAEVVEIVNLFPDNVPNRNSFFSIGLHPWFIVADTVDSDLAKIEKKLQNKKLIAVGECGLDRLKGPSMQLQTIVLIRQLHIAERLQLPVLIHCVKAFGELLLLRKKHQSTVPWVMHGFRGKQALAVQLLQAGFYLSFGAALLHNKALQAVFVAVPSNRVFLETDDSDEPIEAIYSMAAQLSQCAVEELVFVIKKNFNTVFNVHFE